MAFVEPGNVVTRRTGEASEAGRCARRGAAAPAADAGLPPGASRSRWYHDGQYRRRAGNAKTMTDHIAVLRPHAWIMLGHCAGLRTTQQLGDYVLAHGYVREDHVLDEDVPLWVPLPPLAEVQLALEGAVADDHAAKGL